MQPEDFPVRVVQPLEWGDMDAFGHLNNTVYLRYFENARIAYFDAIDLPGFSDGEGIGPILASLSCRFRLPLTYPDTVTTGARVTELHDDRFTMRYAVFSSQHAAMAANGEGVVVTYDYRQRAKSPLPSALRERIAAIEQS